MLSDEEDELEYDAGDDEAAGAAATVALDDDDDGELDGVLL